jgi:hypothetical protein
MDAVLGKASDPAAPADLRVAALTVLASYVDPRIGELREASAWEYPQQRFTIYSRTHANQVQGTLALEQDYVTTIMNRFARIAADDPDERVAAAAGFLRKWLESSFAGRVGPQRS